MAPRSERRTASNADNTTSSQPQPQKRIEPSFAPPADSGSGDKEESRRSSLLLSALSTSAQKDAEIATLNVQLSQFQAEVQRLKTLLSMGGGPVQKEVLWLHEENMRLSSMLARHSGARVVARSRSASPPKKAGGARAWTVSYRKPRTPTPTQDLRNTIASRWTSSKASKPQKSSQRMLSPINSSSRVLAFTASQRRAGHSRMRLSLSPDGLGNEGRTKMREGNMSGPLEGLGAEARKRAPGSTGGGGGGAAVFAYKKVLSFRIAAEASLGAGGGKGSPSQGSPRGGRWKPNPANLSPKRKTGFAATRERDKERGREKRRQGGQEGGGVGVERSKRERRPQRPPMTMTWH